MKILFDQGTPVPLSKYLTGHTVKTVFELGWSNLQNGELLTKAEESFDLFMTTDQQLRYQQNLTGRKLSIIVLMTTSWPRIRSRAVQVVNAVESIEPGEYLEISLI